MLNVLSLFSGIGAFEKALENLGISYNLVGYCEIDKFASKAYSLLHNVPESMNYGDITKVDEKSIPLPLDLITYGFPCQDISIAGKKQGFFNDKGEKTRSGLFFDALRIIEATKPKIAIAENVKNLTSKSMKPIFDLVLNSLEEAGYNNYWQVMNAVDHGTAQARERVFIVSVRKDIDTGFVFPKKKPLSKTLGDYLEDDVDEGYYLNFTQLTNIYNWKAQQRPLKKILGKKSVCRTLTARGAGEYHSGMIIISEDFDTEQNCDNPASYENGHFRILTERESFRLTGFNDQDFDRVKDYFAKARLYKMAGNSICVTVLEDLLGAIYKTNKVSVLKQRTLDLLKAI